MEGSGRVATVIGAVVAVVLQVVVAPNVSLGFAVPDFLLAYAVVVAVARAEHAGPALPFVLGLIFDLLGGGPVGAMAFVFVLVTFLASKAYSLLDNGTHAGPALPFVLGLIFDLLGGGPVGAMAFVFVLVTFLASKAYSLLDNGTMFMPIALVVASLFTGEVLYGALLLLGGSASGVLDAFVYRSLPCALYDCVLGLVMYPLCVRFMAQGGSCIRCACASWRKGGTPNPECRWSASEGGAPRCLSPSPQLS